MPPRVGFVYIVVVVFPVTCTGVIGRIDIDYVHLAFVGVKEQLKSMEIIGIDEHVPWFLSSPALDAIDGHKSGINRLAKTTHDNQVGNGESLARFFQNLIILNCPFTKSRALLNHLYEPTLVPTFTFQRDELARTHGQEIGRASCRERV